MFCEQRERVEGKSMKGFSLQKNRKVLKDHIPVLLSLCLFGCFLWGFVGLIWFFWVFLVAFFGFLGVFCVCDFGWLVFVLGCFLFSEVFWGVSGGFFLCSGQRRNNKFG